MKLSKRNKRGGNLQLNMTPMIDCVFLLLIFFMTCTQVSAVNKTEMELSQQMGAEEQVEATIIINVDQDGDLLIGGNIITLPHMIVMVSDAIATKGNNPQLVNVVLRADRRSVSRPVNQVLSALVKLEITKVRVAVVEAES